MKKFIALTIMVVMVFAMTLSVGAVGGFIDSPSNNKAPIIIEFESTDGSWSGEIYITSYGDRNVLDLVERENLEKAYESIRNAAGVSSLNPDLSGIAGNLNISPDNLGISDLFHIGVSDITDGKFQIKLDADTLSNFVGLIYYEDGKWYIVEDAKIDDNNNLIFTTEVPRAFAVVVDVDNSVIDVPTTGDIIPWVLMVIMAVSAAGIVVVLISYKKRCRA